MPNLASLESVVSLGFKAHTFALFALRWHAKRTQMTRATRNAWRGGRGRGERCTNGRVRSMRRRDAQAMRGPRSARSGGAGGERCTNGLARSMRCRDAQVMRGLRSAWRGGAWAGRRACGWPCAKHAAQGRAGNALVAKVAAWTMWAICKWCRRGAWGKGVGHCNGTCGAAWRGASGRRVLGARAGA